MSRLAKYFLFFLLLICFYFLYRMFEPYLPVILITIVLASVSYPIYNFILKLFKNKEWPASLVTCLLVIVLIVGPLFLIGLIIVNKVIDSYFLIQNEINNGTFYDLNVAGNWKSLASLIKEYAPFIELDEFAIKDKIIGFIQQIGSSLIDISTTLVSNIGFFIAKFFIMIFTLFFIYKDGKKLLNILMRLSPLSGKNEQRIVDKFADVSKSVIMGIFLTALVQGCIGGIGVWITPLSGPTFWGLLLGCCSLIPLIGNALVWIPLSIYLISTGDTGYGIFLLIYCGTAFILIENVFKPYLIKGKTEMHPLIVFFSLIGGLYYFGMAGIIFGPLIAGLCQALLEIYEMEFQEELEENHHILEIDVSQKVVNYQNEMLQKASGIKKNDKNSNEQNKTIESKPNIENKTNEDNIQKRNDSSVKS